MVILTDLCLHVPDALVLLTAGHALHVDLLVVAAPDPGAHVGGPDPGVLQTLALVSPGPGLDTPPVEDEDGGDGGPEDGAQPAAAQAQLQPGGDIQEVFM